MSIIKLFLSVTAVMAVVIVGFVFLNQDDSKMVAMPIAEQPEFALNNFSRKATPIIYDTVTPSDDITNEDIAADLSGVLKDMEKLSEDAASIDSSFKDKPLSLE